MVKYIEANALEKQGWLLVKTDGWNKAYYMKPTEVPAADAIEIVRCNDCIYSQDRRVCNLPYGMDGYCPLGKGYDDGRSEI